MVLNIKRIYDEALASDGYRILVDRLWPRGLSKDKARVDCWLKEIGPSTALRKWFNHDPALFNEFVARYQAELDGSPAFATLRQLVKEHDTVTLLYAAHDTEHNNAVVLRQLLGTKR